MQSAARHARSGASSDVVGKPNRAITPSPVKLLMTPPCWCTHSVSKPDTRFINEYDASSPKRSANAVKPTTSAKRTVIWRRSPSAAWYGRAFSGVDDGEELGVASLAGTDFMALSNCPVRSHQFRCVGHLLRIPTKPPGNSETLSPIVPG